LGSEPALVLAFDTSAAHCAAALVQGDAVLAAASEPMSRGQAERLMPLLEDLLSAAGVGWGDLDAIGVGIGPGNFTGVRISVAAARGLALALGIPAVGVSAFEAHAEGLTGPVLALADSGRGEILAQVLKDGRALAPAAASLEAFAGLEGATLCTGFDARRVAGVLGTRAGVERALPDPARIARVARARLDAPVARPAPLYLRSADAAPSAETAPVLLDDA
jgi:tRNA threonylcarbamoyladenosine biosynthesis protein TsaB